MSDNDDVIFILSHSSFIESNFKNLFEKYEGSSCCADKSRTIVKSLIHHFVTGEPIRFNYDQEYTYHLPKGMFRVHSEIIGFYKALKALHYGKFDKYITELGSIMQQASHKAE
ncbi:hypothetical protein OAF54_01760 [bacterium]|nr:hypothetical protein [bacterium]